MSYRLKILSFDPGLSTSGWNLSVYDTSTNIMYIEKCGMLFPNENVGLASNKENYIRYGHRIMTLDQLRNDIRELMNTLSPDFVVSEDAFYNPTRPTAPKIAKQVISGFGGAEKLGVQYAVTHKEDIKFDNSIDVKNLSEHTCDSIGIGYTFIQEILPSILDIWRNLNDQEAQKIYRR